MGGMEPATKTEQRPLYVDGQLTAFLNINGEPDLPDGIELWRTVQAPLPPRINVRLEKLTFEMVEDRDRKERRLEPVVVELSDDELRPQLEDMNWRRIAGGKPPLNYRQLREELRG